MVLFKRKTVRFLSPPPILNENQEVWVIADTDEVFVDYESYLKRIEFYRQRKFSCEITGHSALTFFEAKRSEMTGSKEVDDSFPDALKEPVLRKVQFSQISRIDHLVDQVFEDFKHDFYPGERVTVLLTDGSRLDGLVREKAKFPEIITNGVVERKAFSRYFVRLINRPYEEALVDDQHIVRDRKAFTKQMLRSFLKHCLTRESWNGAPWLVKEEYARDYRIDMNIPPELRQNHKATKKAATGNTSNKQVEEGIGQSSFWAGSPPQQRLPALKPAVKSSKQKISIQEQEMARQENAQELQRAMNGHTFVVSNGTKPTKGGQFIQENNNFPAIPPAPPITQKPLPKPVLPPPIKYPIEDLDVPPVRDGTHRPALKFLSQDIPFHTKTINAAQSEGAGSGISMESVGALIETWLILNVFCEGFVLDSFTFDDYIEAVQFTSDDVECELFVEIHCAVLKQLVNSQIEGGSINISLPEIDEEDESETSHITSIAPTPEPEPKPRGMRTRSSLIHVETIEEEKPPAEVRLHGAPELVKDDNWIERLQKREFQDGGWQVITVGLLYQLSLREDPLAEHRLKETGEKESPLKKKIDRILIHLVPLDTSPSQESVAAQYASLDVNLRISVLEILCMLTMETPPIRAYLTNGQSQMTELRKDKIEHQRNRKLILEELRALEEEARQLQPNEPTPAPIAEIAEIEDSKMAGVTSEEEPAEEAADSEDEEPIQSRSLRRGADRAAERKRKQEQERERKERAEINKQTKGDKQYQKVLKKIEGAKARVQEEEAAINDVDDDLREADCARLKLLGFDRFWNRYYLAERNAMPYTGLPGSSTASAEYACARLFVQGPDEAERLGFVDVERDVNKEYYRHFQMTICERKKSEEGPTSVYTANQYGFYDDPDSIEMLIGWLDQRGEREKKLRRELQIRREVITTHMKNRKNYLAPKAASGEPPTRMATRTKTHVDTKTHRCLKWTNNMARSQFGHLHSEPPPNRNKKAKRSKVDDGSRVQITNRQGKPLTRQGTRYNFK